MIPHFIPLFSGGPSINLLAHTLSWWELDEASGDRSDSGTNSLDLTDVNTVGSATGVGGVGTAADFVAANSESLLRTFASGITALEPGTGSQTIAAWVHPDIVQNVPVYAFQQPGSPRAGIGVLVTSAGIFQFDVRDSAGTRINPTTTGLTYTTGAWNLVIAKLNRESEKWEGKINNVEVTAWGGSESLASLGTVSGNVTDGLRLGANATASSFFDGRLAKVAVFDKVTTNDEDKFLWNNGLGRLFSELK